MLMSRDWYQGLQRGLLLAPDGEGGGSEGANGDGGNAGAAGAGQAGDPLAGLSPEAKAAVQKQIDAAAASARKAGEKAGKTEAEQAAAAKAAADREAAEQAEAIKRGEFDTVKASLERERDAEKGKTERVLKIALADLPDRIKALDDLGDKELSAAFAAITDPIDQLEWLNDARTKAAMRVARESKEAEAAKGKPRVGGVTPRPTGQPNTVEVQPLATNW